ncbi:MAG: hypothetical protein S0880_08825 [Actinomycetota bacterium]|nr:hypothetical protein [Actinomycetota bacterium]
MPDAPPDDSTPPDAVPDPTTPPGTTPPDDPAPDGAIELRADCDRCAGLCCVAPAFAASTDFAIDKPAGTPCPNLDDGFRCTIHAQLRPKGFAGCVAFDCHGAGQTVTQVTFGGRDWRRHPEVREQMFDVFAVMRHLHTFAVHLTEATTWPAAAPVHDELRQRLDEVVSLTRAGAEELAALDLAPVGRAVDELLTRASTLVRQLPA